MGYASVTFVGSRSNLDLLSGLWLRQKGSRLSGLGKTLLPSGIGPMTINACFLFNQSDMNKCYLDLMITIFGQGRMTSQLFLDVLNIITMSLLNIEAIKATCGQ